MAPHLSLPIGIKLKDYSVNFVEPDDSTIHNILFSFYLVQKDTLLHDKVVLFMVLPFSF